MKRGYTVLAVALLIALFSTSFVFAASGPAEDSYVTINEPTLAHNSKWLSVYGSTAGCTVTDYTLIKLDLRNVSQQIGRATLELTVAPATTPGSTGSATVGLYEVASTWNEVDVTWNNDPIADPKTSKGALIQSIAAPTAQNQTITFGSAFGPSNLAGYLDANKGNYVSVAVFIEGVCGAQSSAVRFASKENVDAGAKPPALNLFSATAVDMSSASAQQQPSWPLYGGLAAVALLVVAGVTISRRRTA